MKHFFIGYIQMIQHIPGCIICYEYNQLKLYHSFFIKSKDLAVLNISCYKTINYLLKSWIITFSINSFVVVYPWITQPTNIICKNIFVFNLIIYPFAIFWWSLAIQNLIWHFLIWSYSHICWISFFSFYFYKYFWTYFILSSCR